MRFIDYIGAGNYAASPWNFATLSAAATASVSFSNTGTAYLIQGITVYGGSLSNASVHIDCSAGANLFSAYVGSAGPFPLYIPLNIEVLSRNTLSVGVLGGGTAGFSIHGHQIPLVL